MNINYKELLPLYVEIPVEEFERDLKALDLIGLSATISKQWHDDCYFKAPTTEAELNFFCALYAMGYYIKTINIASNTVIVKYWKCTKPLTDRDELIEMIKSSRFFIKLPKQSLNYIERLSRTASTLNEPLKTVAILVFILTLVIIMFK